MRLPVLKNSGQEDKTRKSGFVSLANGPAAIICYLCSVCVCVCYTGRFVGWVLARPFLSLFPLLYINYDFCIVAPTRQERHTTLRGGGAASEGATCLIYSGRLLIFILADGSGQMTIVSPSNYHPHPPDGDFPFPPVVVRILYFGFSILDFNLFFFHWKSVSVIYCPFK